MKQVKESNVCFHCGDPCGSDALMYQEHSFCCEGCKTVYQLLDENSMCRYYDLDENAGLKMDHPLAEGKYAFLDNPELSASLFRFKKPEKAMVQFFIPGMHCASCIWLIERLYKFLPGVLESRVNFDRKEVAIQFNPEEVSIRQVVEKLSALGYEPALITGNEEKKEYKSLLYRLGVAGFCTGNIMLFSFPEYLGMDPSSQETFSPVFQWLNLSLSIPVVFFSAQPFFAKAWKGLKYHDLNIDFPLALGIATLFIRSLLEVSMHWGQGFFDSLSALVFFLLIGRWLQDRAYEAMSFDRNFRSYFPMAVEVLSNDEEASQYRAIGELKVSERIRVRNQELIPADAILESGAAQIDYSFVNGESEIESAQIGDVIHAGGRQVGSSIILQVMRPVSESYLSALWNQQDKKEGSESIRSFSDWVGRYFTIALVFIALATLFYWLRIDTYKAFHAFTAVLIVACPCVLVVAAPFAFGNAMRWLAKKGIFLKSPDTVERVARVNEVVFDKTGTLTKQSASLEEIFNELNREEQAWIGGLCAHSSHPVSRMLHRYLGLESQVKTENYKEFPGKGIEAKWGENVWRVGSAHWILDGIKDEKESGVCVSVNGVLKARYRIDWHFRDDLDGLFANWDLPRYLYSGDRDTSRSELLRWFPEDHLHFRVSPEEKLKALRMDRERGQYPMMVGDGLNDAGALKEAWLGVSVTEDVHAFTPACDVIMVGKSISELPGFVRFCKNTLKTVKFSFLFSLVYNSIWMSFAVRGELQPLFAALLMPISSVTVFALNTIGIRYFARKERFQ
ncbi:MAG: HAD-IC family P-type ATPase [Bacteroidetes bacterium]|nr:HAD-IC family P-type ATPase [Bacteroidota bacterium]